MKTIHQQNPRRALIDGDVLVYRTGFAGQKKILTATSLDGKVLGEFPNKTAMFDALGANQTPISGETRYLVEERIELDPISFVYHSLDLQLQHIVQRAGCSRFSVYLTGSGNFRKQIAKARPYKGNRTAERPRYYDDIRARLVNRYGAIVIDGMEADDALAIEMSNDENTVCCSIDKDLRQVAGWHMNWTKDDGPVYIPEEQALRNLWLQVLTGDRVDNIGGVNGIGPKKAEKLLSACDTEGAYRAVALAAYGGDEALLEENYRLVYLLRSSMEIPSEAEAEGDSSVQDEPTAEAGEHLSAVREED